MSPRPADLQGPCLEEDQVLALAELGNRVKKHFRLPQDIEWALDTQGSFYLLQARPLRVSARLKADYLPPQIKGAEMLLSNGIIASRGAAAGPVYLLQGEALDDIPQDAVLVTPRALPEYGVVVGRVAAVVCEAGSATSHLATVLREARIPALFGAKGATAALHPGSVVTVDAYYGNVYAGRLEELLKAPRGGDEAVRQTRAYKVLERVLKHITPLNLLDPRGANFRPEGCRTYHDITRFAHEKAMEELFQVSAGRLDEEGARRLVSTIPLELNIIDLGGGLSPEAANLVKVRPEHLTSRPMLAYWRGVSAVGWQGPKPVDLAGFMSVVMTTATDTNITERLHEKNFAIITHDYMNLSNRLGFHFATIEAFLGAPGESYVSFTFYGGGAELPRRMRRVRFLTRILEDLGFRVEPKEDSITARIDGYDADTLDGKLEVLGRLMMVSKQLDMVMLSEDAVEQYYREFSEGHIPATLLGGPTMPMGKIGFRRLLAGLGILVIVLLALAFILGIVSLKRTQEIVSDDFQQQQLILAKTTARQIEDGLAFLRRELRILVYSPSIQYLEDVAWANRMKVSFDELSKLGVTAIERIDFTGSAADQAYILDAGGHRVIRQDFSAAPEVIWARDPAHRGLIYQSPIEVVPQGEYHVPIMDLATPVYEESVDESHPKATGKLDGVLIFKIDVSTFAGQLLRRHPLRAHRLLLGDGQQGDLPLSPRKGIHRPGRLHGPGAPQPRHQLRPDQRDSENQDAGG